MSFQQLQEQYDLDNRGLLRYLIDYYTKQMKPNPSKESSGLIRVVKDVYEHIRVISTFYKSLEDSRQETTIYIKKEMGNLR